MLCFSRRSGESFQIGSDVTVHISRVDGGQVKVSVEAPQDIKILRSELIAADEAPPSDAVLHQSGRQRR